MAFENVPPVPAAQQLIDAALSAGRSAKVTRKRTDTPLTYAQKKERERIRGIRSAFSDRLRAIPRRFPSVEELSEFYRELLANDLDLDAYKQRLGRLQNLPGAINKIGRQAEGTIRSATNASQAKDATKRFIGRSAGMVEALDKDLSWLEEVRKRFLTYPTLKQRFTVCIAGFPNVGKSTLLRAMTGSNVEVNSYAFTTKSLNVGTLQVGPHKVQVIDTPGTLNRDHDNAIERQAHLALKHVADLIIYVFDPTEEYVLADQEALFARTAAYGRPVLCYLSKQDITSSAEQAPFRELHSFLSQEELVDAIRERVKIR